MGGKCMDAKTVQAITHLYKAGHSSKEICELKGLKLKTVQNFIHRFKTVREGKLPLSPKTPGKPKKVSERTQSVLHGQVEVNPSLAVRELKEQNHTLLGNVSLHAVQQTLLCDLGYRHYRQQKKPLINDKQRRMRLNFAKKYRDWYLGKCRTVLWSDESNLCEWRRPIQSVLSPWLRCDWALLRSKGHKTPSQFNGVGLSFYGVKNLFSQRTQLLAKWNFELLNDHLEDWLEKTHARIFQQDSASPHTAWDVIQWLDDCSTGRIDDWPGNSPGISPIKNLPRPQNLKWNSESAGKNLSQRCFRILLTVYHDAFRWSPGGRVCNKILTTMVIVDILYFLL